jgi:hypothetical protein
MALSIIQTQKDGKEELVQASDAWQEANRKQSYSKEYEA